MPGTAEVKLQAKINLKPRTIRRPTVAKDRAANSPEFAKRKEIANVDASENGSTCGRRRPSSVKNEAFQRRRKPNGAKCVKIVPEGAVAASLSSLRLGVEAGKRRCAWITAYSEPLYVSFHDEEWGVPVHDDRKLFELLILSMTLAELSWPTILKKRSIFRTLFEDYDPSSVAKFTETKIFSLKSCGSSLSEQKLRAIVENAKQILKLLEEFGSFCNYCWTFVNHRPIVNGYRYANQVPVKSPKAEAISKDLMQRGFRCVGPTVIYSFMQAAGIVNDHLLTCFRFKQCSILCNSGSVVRVEKSSKQSTETCSLQALATDQYKKNSPSK